MSYIDQSDYKNLLNKFAQGTQKQKLQENYVDLKPINSLAEYSSPMVMSTNDAKYAGSMEEADIKNPGKYDKKPYDLDGDGVPNKADKFPKDGAKHEGIIGNSQDGMHATGQTVQTTEGLSLGNLSLEERTELKNYVDSIKTTKKAIQELLAKAKTPKMEGGDMMGTKSLSTGTSAPTEEPIKEFGNVSSKDFQIEKVSTLVGDAINSITSNENDRDTLVNAFERSTVPGADIFAIADDLRDGKITVDGVKAIVRGVATKLGINQGQNSITPGAAIRKHIATKNTQSHKGPDVGKKGFDY